MHRITPLRQFIKIFLMLAVLGTAFSGTPANGERLRINPIPPDVAPQWVAMPDLPQMYYAPNIPTDVFRHLGYYYFYWEGIWYKGRSTKGPWMRLQQPPAILSRIQASYFKPQGKGGGQPPGGAPPPETLIGPDGKPVLPPAPPTAPEPATPAPPPPPPFEGVTPSPPETPAPESPTPPPLPETPSPEPVPPAAPEGPMPKAM